MLRATWNDGIKTCQQQQHCQKCCYLLGVSIAFLAWSFIGIWRRFTFLIVARSESFWQTLLQPGLLACAVMLQSRKSLPMLAILVCFQGWGTSKCSNCQENLQWKSSFEPNKIWKMTMALRLFCPLFFSNLSNSTQNSSLNLMGTYVIGVADFATSDRPLLRSTVAWV